MVTMRGDALAGQRLHLCGQIDLRRGTQRLVQAQLQRLWAMLARLVSSAPWPRREEFRLHVPAPRPQESPT